jgi:hypothetical protein
VLLHAKVTESTAKRFCSVFLNYLGRADTLPERPTLRAIS